ncbi:MFS general substrate transporter [Scleroderma citrinum]
MSDTRQLQLLNRGSSCVEDPDCNVDDLDLTDFPTHTSDRNTHSRHVTPRIEAYLIRWLALLCACCFGIGSHYASWTLGPLKSRLARELGTSDVEFSLLISALSLNGTWTPLLGGVMASKLGTTLTSIIATGVVFGGQALVLLGDMQGSVRLMVFGLFVFGLGTSPLSVVQESIIVRLFNTHGLGVSMALGLLAGKGASFISARTSYPLTERFGRHAPFIASTSLTGLSFVVNLVYIFVSKWLVRMDQEASEAQSERGQHTLHSISETEALEKVARKHYVNLSNVLTLGDIFWAYIGLNVLCGMVWSPFTHLASNILERRYELDEADASTQASYLLVGSLVLYPACGYLVDRIKRPQFTLRLFMLSAIFTTMGYTWLSMPPQWTRTPLPGILSFSFGLGFSPLLLVVIVPALVPLKYVSTTLGLHKSLEHAGSTIVQVLAGMWLDKRKPLSGQLDGTIQYLLLTFLLLNILQILVLIVLAYLYWSRWRIDRELGCTEDADIPTPTSEGYTLVDQNETEMAPIRGASPIVEEQLLLTPSVVPTDDQFNLPNPAHDAEIRRGRNFACACILFICFSWLLFLGTALFQLRSKEDRPQNSAN